MRRGNPECPDPAGLVRGGGVTNLFMEGFPHAPALVGGVLEETCQAVLSAFFENLRRRET